MNQKLNVIILQNLVICTALGTLVLFDKHAFFPEILKFAKKKFVQAEAEVFLSKFLIVLAEGTNSKARRGEAPKEGGNGFPAVDRKNFEGGGFNKEKDKK